MSNCEFSKEECAVVPIPVLTVSSCALTNEGSVVVPVHAGSVAGWIES